MDLIEAGQRGFDAAARHPWELARLDVARRLIARHVDLPPGAVVLDVGCGDTFVVERLAAEYPDVRFHAIDTAFTGEVMTLLRARFRTPNVFVASSLDSVDPPTDRRVSLVILMDVLEHIDDDRGFLASLFTRPYIGDDVQVLATVPAFQALFCSHDTALGHFRRYSLTGLRALLHGSGLRVVDSGYFFFTLLPVRLLAVMRERLTREAGTPATGLVTWSGGRAATSVLKRLLLIDAWLGSSLRGLGIGLPGLSTYAVCRKSA
jgi:hypothetical protein